MIFSFLRQPALIISICLITISCGRPTTQSSDTKLIGGYAQNDARIFPGVVHLWAGCTAAKIGRKLFVTAAHCVYQSGTSRLKPRFRNRGKFFVSKSLVPEESSYVDLGVARVSVNPTYARARRGCSGSNCNGKARDSYDMAKIWVKELSPRIPIMRIDYRRVRDGDHLMIVGYGCEVKLGGPAPEPKRLKYQALRALSAGSLNHRGGYSSASRRQEIYSRNILTNGKKYSQIARGASLCPGDSGGPLLKWDRVGRRFRFVGVNSYYSFLPGVKISYTNWHARASNVRRWLSYSPRIPIVGPVLGAEIRSL